MVLSAFLTCSLLVAVLIASQNVSRNADYRALIFFSFGLLLQLAAFGAFLLAQKCELCRKAAEN